MAISGAHGLGLGRNLHDCKMAVVPVRHTGVAAGASALQIAAGSDYNSAAAVVAAMVAWSWSGVGGLFLLYCGNRRALADSAAE